MVTRTLEAEQTRVERERGKRGHCLLQQCHFGSILSSVLNIWSFAFGSQQVGERERPTRAAVRLQCRVFSHGWDS